jgi:hypothetical protein
MGQMGATEIADPGYNLIYALLNPGQWRMNVVSLSSE